MTRSGVRRHLYSIEKKGYDLNDETAQLNIANQNLEAPKQKCEVSMSGDSGTITTESASIRTLEDALEYSEVDLKKYEVDRFVVNSWEVTMGGKNSRTGQAETYTNYQVKVWLKRKVVGTIAMENLFDRFKEGKPLPKQKLALKRRKHARKIMLEPSIYDHHFGMLAWGKEVHDDYDLDIAKELYVRAINKFLDDVAHYDVEKIVFPIGNDLFHINDNNAETPASKNRLDVDGRMAKVIETAEEAVLYAIERMASIAELIVPWIPGNHDPQLSFALCKYFKGRFHNYDHVTIDTSPNERKYIRYGQSLTLLTHGDMKQMQHMIFNMVEEAKQDFVETDCHEIHSGHTHKEKEFIIKSADHRYVATCRTIPSLTAQDFWHHKKAFSKSGRAAECHIYDKEFGHDGYLKARINALI